MSNSSSTTSSASKTSKKALSAAAAAYLKRAYKVNTLGIPAVDRSFNLSIVKVDSRNVVYFYAAITSTTL